MAAGHVSKDSWSRCEASSSLYYATRQPNEVNRPPIKSSVDSIGKSQESIEVIQSHLKKEMESKLQNKGLILPHESFVAVVQVGKYLFLAVMLPVYLFLYKVPHWIAAQAIPRCFSLVKAQTFNLGRFAVEITKKAVNLTQGLIEKMIGNALHLSKEHARNLWKNLSFQCKRLAQAISNVTKMPIGYLKKVRESLINLYRQARQHAEGTKQGAIKKFSFLTSLVSKTLSQSLQSLGRTISPIVEKMGPFFEAIKKTFRNVTERSRVFFKTIKTFRNTILTPLKKGIDFSKRTFKKGLNLLIEGLEIAKDPLKKVLVKVKAYLEPMISVLVAGWTLIQPIIEKSFVFSKKVFAKISSFSKKGMRALRNSIPQSLRENLHKQLKSFLDFSRAFKSLGKGWRLGCRALLEGAKKFVQMIREMLVRIMLSLKKILKSLYFLMVDALKKICRFLLSFLKATSFIIVRTAFAAYVVVLIFWYAALNGYYLAKHFSSSLK